jgi:hypothetical protein
MGAKWIIWKWHLKEIFCLPFRNIRNTINDNLDRALNIALSDFFDGR